MIDLPGLHVSRETEQLLAEYKRLLLEGNERQNLVSRTSMAEVESRHLLDSAQLLTFGRTDARWLDIGSGPGLPGLVLAILGVRHITLVEPRRLRTDFLDRCVERLALTNVRVVTGKVEQVDGPFDIITARAVASIDRLFTIAVRLTGPKSQWVLPKGRSAAKELAEAQLRWQGAFRLEPSLTDPEARILVAGNVRRRTGRG